VQTLAKTQTAATANLQLWHVTEPDDDDDCGTSSDALMYVTPQSISSFLVLALLSLHRSTASNLLPAAHCIAVKRSRKEAGLRQSDARM
jgi:hypothetical protein